MSQDKTPFRGITSCEVHGATMVSGGANNNKKDKCCAKKKNKFVNLFTKWSRFVPELHLGVGVAHVLGQPQLESVQCGSCYNVGGEIVPFYNRFREITTSVCVCFSGDGEIFQGVASSRIAVSGDVKVCGDGYDVINGFIEQ